MQSGGWVVNRRRDVKCVFHDITIINEKTAEAGGLSYRGTLFLVRVETVLFVETIDPAIRLGKPLFTGEEWVAVAASIDADFLRRRACFECGSAGDAGDQHFRILRVNAFFHTFALLPP